MNHAVRTLVVVLRMGAKRETVGARIASLLMQEKQYALLVLDKLVY
jgi:hypothetical protein